MFQLPVDWKDFTWKKERKLLVWNEVQRRQVIEINKKQIKQSKSELNLQKKKIKSIKLVWREEKLAKGGKMSCKFDFFGNQKWVCW